MLLIRKNDGEKYLSRTINLLLCGLQHYTMEHKPRVFDIFYRDNEELVKIVLCCGSQHSSSSNSEKDARTTMDGSTTPTLSIAPKPGVLQPAERNKTVTKYQYARVGERCHTSLCAGVR